MRRVRLSLVMVLLVSMLGLGTQVSADTWDYVYGEDPTNADNLSVFTDVRIDPLGGVFLFGYFFGQYEDLNSSGRFARFAQHRGDNGAVDWTILLPNNQTGVSTTPPVMPSSIEVDGNGVAFLSETRLEQYGWFSVDRSGLVTIEQGR